MPPPIEPIRGLSFEEYLRNAWKSDDDGRNFMAELTCKLAGMDQTTLRMMPKQLQVYRFEIARSFMLDVLKKDTND